MTYGNSVSWCWLKFNFDLNTVYNVIYHTLCLRLLINVFKEWSETENDAIKHAEIQKQCIKEHLTACFANMIFFNKTAT